MNRDRRYDDISNGSVLITDGHLFNSIQSGEPVNETAQHIRPSRQARGHNGPEPSKDGRRIVEMGRRGERDVELGRVRVRAAVGECNDPASVMLRYIATQSELLRL